MDTMDRQVLALGSGGPRWEVVDAPSEARFGLDVADLIQDVEFSSAWTPTFSVNFQGPSDPNTTAQIMTFLESFKPKFVVRPKGGLPPATLAPFGDPGVSKWPTLKLGFEVGGGLLVGLLAYALVEAVLPRKKRS